MAVWHGGPYSGTAGSRGIVFAEHKQAEGKENEEVALEKTDDIHDVMVGPHT